VTIIDGIYQDAFCLTYGMNTCSETEISLIQDSILLPESLIKQFEDHPDITLMTFSTGTPNVKKTILTFQLSGGNDPEFYELFKLQLENSSNGLYIPNIHITLVGSYISISTNNIEYSESNNSRLQQWIKNILDVISKTNDDVKNFIPNTRQNYNILNSASVELDETINKITNVVDSGVEDYTEYSQIKATLQEITEDVIATKFNRIFESTIVRDILEDTSDVDQSLSAVTPINVTLSKSTNISNFETVNNDVLKIIDTLSTVNPTTVKSNITKSLSNLKDIPLDILETYTKNIFDSIDKFPFSSTDSIKGSVIGYSEKLASSYINKGSDFISNAKGDILTSGSNVMSQFGITAAKDAFNKFSNPGNITNMVKEFGSDYIDSAMEQLPIDDVKIVMDNAKKFTNYLDFSGSGDMLKQYSQKVMDAGISSLPINNVVSGIKSQISSLGNVVSNLENGAMSKLDAVKEMANIGPTIQSQINTLNSYAKNLTSFFSGSTSFSDKFIKAKNDIQKLIDVTYLLKTPADAVAQSAGCVNGAKCLLAYGLKSLG